MGGTIHAIRGRGLRAGVGMREVQADLRTLFCRWGLPNAVRMDRDSVFGAAVDWNGLER